MSQIGLIIGRFQPLHKGHLLLIENSLRENPVTLILIGSTNKNDKNNPYLYEFRKDLIQGEFRENKLFIGELPDFPTDQEWIKNIQNYIPKRVTLCKIYCGDKENDSAIKSIIHHKESLPFDIEITEIPRSVINISATQIRKYLTKNNEEKLRDFLGDYTLKKLRENS